MRKKMLFGIIFLATINIYAQESADHIELLGKEISGMDGTFILIPDWEDVDYIVAEAVYACGTAPGDIKISSKSDERIIEPQLIPCDGNIEHGMITSVFRTKFTTPTPRVTLDILDNAMKFRSFSLYIHRDDGKVNYLPAVGMEHLQGELQHVNSTEKIPELTAFTLPLTAEARDVQLKFALTEFKDDDLVAVFTFESKGEVIATEIRTWFQNGQVDNYAVQELVFKNVSGDVDKVQMTMFSAQDKMESFIAGKVFVDIQPNRIAMLTASGN